MSDAFRSVATPSSPAAARSDVRSYGLVGGSFLLFAMAAPLVAWADAPVGLLMVIRYALATATLLLVYARHRPLRSALRTRRWRRLLLVAALDALMMLVYFFAVRTVGVALATFFFFLQPLWVMLLERRRSRAATGRSVYVALALAVVGMAFIVWPALVGTARFSPVGLTAALASGWIFAFFQVVVKKPARQIPYETLVTAQCLLDLMFILPFGLWQFLGTAHGLTVRDCIAGLVMGLVATALANAMWWRGVGHISVQHSSILGLITPVAAAVYAYIFLGQSLSAPTIAGGVFILCAGGLVVLFGSGGTEPQTPP